MKVTLYFTPNNNHGCQGFEVTIELVTAKIGRVVGKRNCSNCSDRDSGLLEGQLVQLPSKEGTAWRSASMLKRFPQLDISSVCASRVRPHQLIETTIKELTEELKRAPLLQEIGEEMLIVEKKYPHYCYLLTGQKIENIVDFPQSFYVFNYALRSVIRKRAKE